MDLPEIGELNRRVKILVREAKPDDRNGFSQTTVEKDEVWGKLAVVGSGDVFRDEAGEFGSDAPRLHPKL